MTYTTNFSAGTTVTSNWLNAIDEQVFETSANVQQFGAVGDGTTDDTSAIQSALSSGAKVVYGKPGATYLVSHVGTVTVSGTAQRYCLLVPTGVIFDLNGATIKAASASNSSPIMLYNLTDAGVRNGVIDCNKSNQSSPATGEIAGIYVFGCTRPIVENIRAKNCRMYAGRFLSNTGGRYLNLWCTDSDGDGWSFGVDGGGTYHIYDAFIDNIYSESCTGVYGGGFQGNPIIFTAQRCTIGKIIGKSCAGGIKIQDSSQDLTVGEVSYIGQTNGSTNSGFKIQGNGAGLQPKRIKVGSVNAYNAYGNGLFIADVISAEVGQVHTYTCGTGASSSGSNLHSVYLSIPSGGRLYIGSLDSDSPAGGHGVMLDAGYCKIGSVYGKSAAGIGFQVTTTGTFECDDMRLLSGAAAQFDFQATGGKGHIRSITSDTAHAIGQSRVKINTALYDWTIDSIRLGSTDTLEGTIQLTNGATATAVTCGHIWQDYVGGSADNFQPYIALYPMRSSTMALGAMRAVPTSGGVGTGFSIKHAAAGAADYVQWKVLFWKTGSQAIT